MAPVHYRLVGVVRVCAPDPDAQVQRDALAGAGCGKVFEETVSTRNSRPPGLAAALMYLRPGDALVVWRLDRLGRSVQDVVRVAEDLRGREVGLRVLTGALAGTYWPNDEGQSFFAVVAGLVELEQDLIRERPTVIDADKLTAARARCAKGEVPPRSPRLWGSSRATVYRHLAAITDEDAEQVLPEDAAPASGQQPGKSPPGDTEQQTTRAPKRPRVPRAARQRWFVVEANSEDPTGPVVVLSTHGPEKAATTARGRVRRRPTGPQTARYEVRTASGITTRVEYDPGRGRAVVRDEPPV